MKIRYFIIFAVACIALSQCNKDESDGPYSNGDIVLDNARAAMYFHTIFCEAENAWAFVHNEDYQSFEPVDMGQANASSSKMITYNENTDTVTIVYNAWISNELTFDGTMIVVFDTCSYRKPRETARVQLVDFFIEEQGVTGRTSILYRDARVDDHDRRYDQYTFTVTDGSAIREKGNNNVLITVNISGGNYERVDGGDTPLDQYDDLWKYWGTMTGMLRGKTNLRYTNTVVSTQRVNNVNYDAAIRYDMGMDCKTAQHEYHEDYQVYSEIKIQGRDDIQYVYFCNDIYYQSVTHNIRN